MIIRSLVGAAVVAVLTGFAPAPAAAEDVFVRIAAPLDEARGLCLDIPGYRDRVNVTRPLVVHTCKWDIWNLDERFDAEALDQGALRMPTFDLCAGVDRATQGSAIVLGSPWRPTLAIASCGALAGIGTLSRRGKRTPDMAVRVADIVNILVCAIGWYLPTGLAVAAQQDSMTIYSG